MKTAPGIGLLFAAGALAQQGAYFIINSGMPLVLERADPVVSPGQIPSSHVHSVVGGNGFAATMNFAQAQKSTCSTLPPKADKSNYWMPNLYFQDPRNKTFIRVPEQPQHKIYYKYGTGANVKDADITAFPDEFRMIAGTNSARSYDDPSMGAYGSELQWFCHGPEVKGPGIPKGITSCPYGLAVSLAFPSCWNGQDFSTSNPSAHMAYPIADTLQGCPSTHRVKRFPQIFLEYWFDTDTFNGLYTAQDSPFVLANGDPTGYGFHADFINGWDSGVLDAVMSTCRAGNAAPISTNECFGGNGGLYTDDEMHACTQAPLLNENVGWTYGQYDTPGSIGGNVGSKLPGCNPIQPGPGPATVVTSC